MIKPRIILADLDMSYIIPLQLKFIEEFFNQIDFEIISDETYFKSVFATPQRADILIVSEALYTSTLQKHNIQHVFIMMEQYEEGQTDELNVNRLFKYTSIKEIFNEIVSKSANVLHVDMERKKETQVVVIYSATGGVGKTSIALGISACLSKSYKKVCYLNADRLQTFQWLLGNQSAITAMDVYAKLTPDNKHIYQDIKHVIRNEQFCYLPPFKASLMALNLNYQIYETIIQSMKQSNDYDVIIVDADVTFDEDKARLLDLANKVMVVCEQTSASVYATNRLVDNINGTNSEKFMFICNKFDKQSDNALISPNMNLKFIVNDYIETIPHSNRIDCERLLKDTGIQKTAYLII